MSVPLTISKTSLDNSLKMTKCGHIQWPSLSGHLVTDPNH